MLPAITSRQSIFESRQRRTTVEMSHAATLARPVQSSTPATSNSATVEATVYSNQANSPSTSAANVVQTEHLQPGDFCIRVPESGNRTSDYQIAKRLIDVVGASVALVAFSPVMLSVWLVLLVTTRGRPIFSQLRVGKCGRMFRMYKFRTMRLDAEKVQSQIVNEQSGPVFKNRRDPRITRIGGFLRSTSIDEMPQLFNVLLGHMALVGPRPPVPKEVVQYERWQRRRLSVKPGLTCLWQVSGRCEIGFQDWVRMDIWYTKNQNLATDLRLLWQTPTSVLSRRGAY